MCIRDRYLAEPHGVGAGGAKAKVCPIGRIIAIDPAKSNQNEYPGTNPYETIKPLAMELGLPIETNDGNVSYSTVYDWTQERRATLLKGGMSTVIAWDKQGLNPSAKELLDNRINSKAPGEDNYTSKALGEFGYTPLLKALPVNPTPVIGSGGYVTPNRTDFYVFSQQDASGQFGYSKKYVQQFSDDGGTTWYTAGDKLPDDTKANAAKV